jgi:hypothetical protein
MYSDRLFTNYIFKHKEAKERWIKKYHYSC